MNSGLPLALGAVAALAVAGAVAARRGSAAHSLPRTATLFSGGGLVEVGLEGLIDPVFAVEHDPKIAAVYAAAHGPHVEAEDVRTVTLPAAGTIDALHASPVCKAFSVAKREVGEKDLDIETARATAKAIRRLRPKVFTLENVPGYTGSVALGLIEDTLEDEGYTFDTRVYDAADYGAATHRKRLLLRAVRDGVLPPVPAPTHPKGRQADWYQAVADLVDGMPDVTMPKAKKSTESWVLPRLRKRGVDLLHVERPLLLLGGSAGSGTVPYAYAGGPAPTLKATYKEVHRIFLPDGRIKRLTPRGMARITVRQAEGAGEEGRAVPRRVCVPARAARAAHAGRKPEGDEALRPAPQACFACASRTGPERDSDADWSDGMNYLSTLTRPAPAHYGAERSIITPDGRGLNQQSPSARR